MLEFTVFIRVKIDNLKELSKSIPEIVNKEDRINKDNININKEMKNLLTSPVAKIKLENSSLLTYIVFGLACEINSLIENLNNEYNLTNLIPELVEKKEPPIMVNIKKRNDIFLYGSFIEIPILEILLHKAKKILLKLYSELNNKKNRITKKQK